MHKKACESKSDHGPHYHDVSVIKECDGKTPCGRKSHLRHSYTSKEKHQCGGICRCDYVSHPHDPSRHPGGKPVFDDRLKEPIMREDMI